MCGRYPCACAPEQYRRYFGARRWRQQQAYRPSHNVAPGTVNPVCVFDSTIESAATTATTADKDSSPREIDMMKWGIKRGTFTAINARVETLAEKPMFRPLLAHHRCIVIADGYYEWKKLSGHKQPYFIHSTTVMPEDSPVKEKDGKEGKGPLKEESHPPFAPIAMAGLYAKGDDGFHYCIITCAPPPSLASIHDRMPVILSAKAMNEWLDVDTVPASAALKILQVPKEGSMLAYPVDPFVSNIHNNAPRCWAPATTSPKKPTATLLDFFGAPSPPATASVAVPSVKREGGAEGGDEKRLRVGD